MRSHLNHLQRAVFSSKSVECSTVNKSWTQNKSCGSHLNGHPWQGSSTGSALMNVENQAAFFEDTITFISTHYQLPICNKPLWPQFSHNYGTTVLWASERSHLCAKGQLCWEVTLGRGCFKKLPFMMEDGSSHVGKHRGAARKDFSCDLKVRTALRVINTVSVMRFPYLNTWGKLLFTWEHMKSNRE